MADNSFSNIVTFISIIIGFSIISLSLIATSNFAKKLYRLESTKDNSKTLLHIFINKFKNSIYFFTFNIFIILVYQYLNTKHCYFWIMEYSFDFVKIFSNIIWFFTLLSIIRFIFLVNLFSKFILQTVKNIN